MRRLALAALAAAALGPAWPAAAETRPLSFSDLQGWVQDDHAAALAAFRRSCASPSGHGGGGRPSPAALARVCRDARHLSSPSGAEARAFFERHFQPVSIEPAGGRGFLTAYFEPEYPGSLTPTAQFTAPLLARPADLVDLRGHHGRALPGLTAARRTRHGLQPYPDRAAIENGALGRAAHPLVYLDPNDAFVVHVQGSARIRLPDGRVRRVAFAGRNGHPYTAIARVLSQREHIPASQLGLQGLLNWLRSHPEQAVALRQENKSYIFFRLAHDLAPGDGPVGGSGIPLTPGRSLAVDRTAWRYGVPVWLEGELPRPDAGPEPLHRLVVAQDTGTAIVGQARGDLFLGTGEAAGAQAGLVRQPVRFVVLMPRAAHSAEP
jgi:membrane-bound lytic murein transglycosylase A